MLKEDSWLFMVKLQGIFLKFARLPQGGRSSPACCLCFNYGMIEQWREDQGREIVQEQIPGTVDFDPSQPAVLFLDAEGRRDMCSLHMAGSSRSPRTRRAS